MTRHFIIWREFTHKVAAAHCACGAWSKILMGGQDDAELKYKMRQAFIDHRDLRRPA